MRQMPITSQATPGTSMVASGQRYGYAPAPLAPRVPAYTSALGMARSMAPPVAAPSPVVWTAGGNAN